MKNTKQVNKLKGKFFFFLGLINLIVILCTYIIMPIMLNYPPYAKDDLQFQNETEALNHLQQYILLFVLATFIFAIIINFMMRNIYVFLNKYYRKEKITQQEIEKTRKDCLNIPYQFYITAIAVIFSIGISFNLAFRMSNLIILKFSLMFFTIVALITLLQFMFLQRNLKQIILLTYSISSHCKKNSGFRIKFSTNLMIQIIPFLAASIIVISLIGYAKTTQEKGISLMNYYKAFFSTRTFANVNLQDLKAELDSIPLLQESDYYIIIPPDRNNIYTSNPNIQVSDFFLKYLEHYFDKTNGTIYEFYATEQQAYMIKLLDDTGNPWYIGFEYITSDYELMVFYLGIIFGVSLLYTIFIYIWSRNTSSNILNISESLEHVANENDYTTQKFLPILSNDEFGDLAYSYNKIEELTNQHLKEIQNNQDMLIEQERLASLRSNDWRNCTQLKNPYFFCSWWFRRLIRPNQRI